MPFNKRLVLARDQIAVHCDKTASQFVEWIFAAEADMQLLGPEQVTWHDRRGQAHHCFKWNADHLKGLRAMGADGAELVEGTDLTPENARPAWGRSFDVAEMAQRLHVQPGVPRPHLLGLRIHTNAEVRGFNDAQLEARPHPELIANIKARTEARGTTYSVVMRLNKRAEGGEFGRSKPASAARLRHLTASGGPDLEPVPTSATPPSEPEQEVPTYLCEHGCGFSGDLDTMRDHENDCPLGQQAREREQEEAEDGQQSSEEEAAAMEEEEEEEEEEQEQEQEEQEEQEQEQESKEEEPELAGGRRSLRRGPQGDASKRQRL
jgi:hypothetical protein